MRDMVKIYATGLIIVISSFAVIANVFIFRQVEQEALNVTRDTFVALGQTFESYSNEARRLTYSLFPTSREQNDLKYYMQYTFQEYVQKTLYEDYVYFPEKINALYLEFANLEAIVVNLNNEKEVFVSTKENRYGNKYSTTPNIENTIIFTQTLYNQVTYENLGHIHVYISENTFEDKIIKVRELLSPGVLITNEFGTEIFNKDAGVKTNPKTSRLYSNQEKNFGRYHLQVYVPSKSVLNQTIVLGAWITVATLILDFVLIYGLYKTFGNYAEQVEDIIDGMAEVKDGDYSVRLNLEGKDTELYNISSGINEMLNSITDYIEEIYNLEIKQRDINLMALQSQINPHFLYNTLEFIRMYAVSEGVEELAEIVFSFSELLRNNISLERETTLKNELEFVENFVYLHQMRYPDRLAYRIKVDPKLENIRVPKFTLQPLVENYIKHGVDFNRIDNAIDIIVEEIDNIVYIKLKDNGRGTSLENLEKIEERLNRKEIDISSGSSIGLYNVHERLKAYFKDAYSIRIESVKNQGFYIIIAIDQSKL